MASSKVANRYSKSFLDTSIEKNILDKVSSDFDFSPEGTTITSNIREVRFCKRVSINNR